MSSSNLINLMTLIWNFPLNFDVAFCNWLDKFLPPIVLFNFGIICKIEFWSKAVSTDFLLKVQTWVQNMFGALDFNFQ